MGAIGLIGWSVRTYLLSWPASLSPDRHSEQARNDGLGGHVLAADSPNACP
jgi:hypothetical protein